MRVEAVRLVLDGASQRVGDASAMGKHGALMTEELLPDSVCKHVRSEADAGARAVTGRRGFTVIPAMRGEGFC